MTSLLLLVLEKIRFAQLGSISYYHSSTVSGNGEKGRERIKDLLFVVFICESYGLYRKFFFCIFCRVHTISLNLCSEVLCGTLQSYI